MSQLAVRTRATPLLLAAPLPDEQNCLFAFIAKICAYIQRFFEWLLGIQASVQKQVPALPQDLQVKILSYLSLEEFHRLKPVCRAFQRTSQHKWAAVCGSVIIYSANQSLRRMCSAPGSFDLRRLAIRLLRSGDLDPFYWTIPQKFPQLTHLDMSNTFSLEGQHCFNIGFIIANSPHLVSVVLTELTKTLIDQINQHPNGPKVRILPRTNPKLDSFTLKNMIDLVNLENLFILHKNLPKQKLNSWPAHSTIEEVIMQGRDLSFAKFSFFSSQQWEAILSLGALKTLSVSDVCEIRENPHHWLKSLKRAQSLEKLEIRFFPSDKHTHIEGTFSHLLRLRELSIVDENNFFDGDEHPRYRIFNEIGACKELSKLEIEIPLHLQVERDWDLVKPLWGCTKLRELNFNLRKFYRRATFRCEKGHEKPLIEFLRGFRHLRKVSLDRGKSFDETFVRSALKETHPQLEIQIDLGA